MNLVTTVVEGTDASWVGRFDWQEGTYLEEKTERKNMKEMMFPSDQFFTTRVGKQHVCAWLNQDDQLGLFLTLFCSLE